MRRLLPALACLLLPAYVLAQDSPDDLLAKTMENPTSAGLLITDVDPGSQANSVGIASGDILIAYDGKPTPNPEALQTALHALGDKETIWETTSTPPDAQGPNTERHFSPRDLVPTYAILLLAQSMPRVEGTTYRFRPVEEGTGRIMHASALVVAGRTKAELGDHAIEGWQVEWRVLGRPAHVYWFNDQGTLLAVSYGAAVATPSTKQEALVGLHPDLKPKTE